MDTNGPSVARLTYLPRPSDELELIPTAVRRLAFVSIRGPFSRVFPPLRRAKCLLRQANHQSPFTFHLSLSPSPSTLASQETPLIRRYRPRSTD